MGQSIRITYVGAYLDIADENFREVKSGDDFYNEVGEANFRYPYEGLEKVNILIPHGDDFGKEFDHYEEFIINELDTKPYEEKMKKEFTKQIASVEKFFPGKVSVKSGIVSYFDEIA